MTQLDGKSMDIVSENVTKLKELFPEIFDEGKIDFVKLQEELGSFVDTQSERYNFTWAGKTEAKRIAQTPSTGTLRPCVAESKNWDTTQNLYIEGDNLEVLKLLQKSYHKQVKMIYIDPPYNTGKDFVYKDNFHDNIKNYLEITGQVDGEGNRLSANSDTNGRYHSNWLSMMYPRIKLARNLLKDDGVVFIHIGKHELNHLSLICNEIFGETNHLGTIVWDKGNPKGDSNTVAYQHENVLAFAKNIEVFKEKNHFQRPKKNAQKILNKANQLFKKIGKKAVSDELKKCIKDFELDIDIKSFESEYTLERINEEFQQWLSKQDFSNGEKAYKYIDKKGYVYQSVSMAWPNKKKAPDDYWIPLIHPLTGEPCPLPDKGWRNPSVTMKKLLDDDLILFGIDHNTQPRRKYFLHENMEENIASILFYGGSDDELMKEFGLEFDNPKPYQFARELISYVCDSDDVVVDFFSGSATTSHAVMQLNSENGGNRKFIMVQLPESTDQKSYPTICEIGKKRIRLAGDKIIADNSDKDLSGLDIGFKVLKLDSSNIKTWDSDFENLEANLLDAVDNVKSDRTVEDLLYEVLLKYGLDLTLPIEEKSINDSKIYVIGFGALIVCLDDHVTLDTVKHIAKLKEEYAAEKTRVVFKDSSFADAVVKTNALQTLKQFGIDEVVSI